MPAPLTLMWFRRDLRLHDQAAFHQALKAAAAAGGRCLPLFVFDRDILDHLHSRSDRRVEYIHQSVREMHRELVRRGSGLVVRCGHAPEVLAEVIRTLRPHGLTGVYANHDYEPRRRERDAAVRQICEAHAVTFHTYKDVVIFEKEEVLTRQGTPHRVYTPYKNAWYARLERESDAALRPHPTRPRFASALLPRPSTLLAADPWEKLEDVGFSPSGLQMSGGTRAARTRWDEFLARIGPYPRTRDFPALDGTSRLSVALRFGTLSVRELIATALEHSGPGAQKWVDELVWREFYSAILHHFPHTVEHAFRPAFEAVAWDDVKNDPQVAERFSAWCDGRTGYPLVDAGMRQLNQTGFMHNRLRMLTAGFLTRDLHIHWKWGERYFARQLLDYDLSQNLGGWQWAAGTGADAQPYFRIFNPASQGETWDPEGAYVRQYCPELADFPAHLIHHPWDASPLEQQEARCRIGRDYPAPLVDHARERIEALRRFKSCRKDPR